MKKPSANIIFNSESLINVFPQRIGQGCPFSLHLPNITLGSSSQWNKARKRNKDKQIKRKSKTVAFIHWTI